MFYCPTEEEIEDFLKGLLSEAAEQWTDSRTLPLSTSLFLFAVCILSGRRELAEAELSTITETVKAWIAPQFTFEKLGLHQSPAPWDALVVFGFWRRASRFIGSQYLTGFRAIEAAHVVGAEPFCLPALRAMGYACPCEGWERASHLAPALYERLVQAGMLLDAGARTRYTRDLDRKADLVLQLASRLKGVPVAATFMLNLFLAALLIRAGIEERIEPQITAASQGRARRRNPSLAGMNFDLAIPKDHTVSSIAFHIAMGHIRARDERLFSYLANLALLCPGDAWEPVLGRLPDLADALMDARGRHVRKGEASGHSWSF